MTRAGALTPDEWKRNSPCGRATMRAPCWLARQAQKMAVWVRGMIQHPLAQQRLMAMKWG